MSHWLRASATAAQFLTRLPIPGGANAAPAEFLSDLPRMLVLLPLVGAAIGALTAAALLLADLALPLPLAVLLALLVEARITGALHEDAVADACDGLGGGRDAEAVQRILKDSSVGAFGVLGLGLAVALRAASLMMLPGAAAAAVALVVSGAMGRLLMLALMAAVPPVPGREGLAAHIAAAMDWLRFLQAAVLASPVLALGLMVDARAMVVAACACVLFLCWYAKLLRRRLGGSTGDVIGAAAYAGIVLSTLAFALE